MLTRDNFEAVSPEEFHDLQDQNDSWQAGDLTDCQEFIDENELQNYELFRTNENGATTYLVINHDPVQYNTIYL